MRIITNATKVWWANFMLMPHFVKNMHIKMGEMITIDVQDGGDCLSLGYHINIIIQLKSVKSKFGIDMTGISYIPPP